MTEQKNTTHLTTTEVEVETIIGSGYFPVRIYTQNQLEMIKLAYDFQYQLRTENNYTLESMKGLLAHYSTQTGLLDMAFATALDEMIKEEEAKQ